MRAKWPHDAKTDLKWDPARNCRRLPSREAEGGPNPFRFPRASGNATIPGSGHLGRVLRSTHTEKSGRIAPARSRMMCGVRYHQDGECHRLEAAKPTPKPSGPQMSKATKQLPVMSNMGRVRTRGRAVPRWARCALRISSAVRCKLFRGEVQRLSLTL